MKKLLVSAIALTLGLLFIPSAQAAVTYNITFNSNGGQGSPVIAVEDTTDALLVAPTVTNPGHTIQGWSTTPNGSVVGSYIVAGEDYTLYAIWSLDSYPITFDTQGGGANTTVSIPYYTEGLTHAPSVSKPYYNFLGWSASPSGQVTSSYNVAGPATVYAIWAPINYAITFDANGGSGSTTLSLPAQGNALSSAPMVSMVGYDLSGWSTTPNASKLDSYTTLGPVTLYAVWSIKSYNVKFDSNFDNTFKTQSVQYLGNALLNPPVITRKGYTLLGWSNEPKATSPITSYLVLSDSTLYAIWKADTYTVTFEANGASAGLAPNALSYVVDSLPLTLPSYGTLKRQGYVFNGWGKTSTSQAIGSPYIPEDSGVLYALWSEVSKANTLVIFGGKDTSLPVPTNFDSSVPASNLGLGLTQVLVSSDVLKFTPKKDFSGLTSVALTLKIEGKQFIVEVPVLVLPVEPTSLTLSSNNILSTKLSWFSTDPSLSYKVYVDKRLICETKALTCLMARTIGPNSVVKILTYGNDDTNVETSVSYVKKEPIPATTLSFRKGSLNATANGKVGFATLASLVKSKGFTQVNVSPALSAPRARVLYDKLSLLLPNSKIIISGFDPTKSTSKEKPKASQLNALTVGLSLS